MSELSILPKVSYPPAYILQWKTIADFSENKNDKPYANIELPEGIEGRYVRYNHIKCSNRYLSISEFRVFGNGNENKPSSPMNFHVVRQKDRRNAELT